MNHCDSLQERARPTLWFHCITGNELRDRQIPASYPLHGVVDHELNHLPTCQTCTARRLDRLLIDRTGVKSTDCQSRSLLCETSRRGWVGGDLPFQFFVSVDGVCYLDERVFIVGTGAFVSVALIRT